MGQISKTLSTFWFGWEYLSTLNHPLVQFSETAPCLAIANCVYYTVSKEKAIPLHGKMHFHRITPIHLTTNRWPLSDFPRSSLIGIHGQASKNWWCMSDFVCFPSSSKSNNEYSQWLLGFPVCKPRLTLGKKKMTLLSFSLPLPLPSV